MTLEQQIYDTIVSTVEALGFGIVRLRLLKNNAPKIGAKILEILIERQDQSSVGIDDCKIVSQNISAVLDVEDIIEHNYSLEVSSAGLERPLVKLADFRRFVGRVALIKTHKAVGDSKKFEGKLLEAEGDIVKLEVARPKIVMETGFENIKDARLVLTEEMFREIMKRGGRLHEPSESASSKNEEY